MSRITHDWSCQRLVRSIDVNQFSGSILRSGEDDKDDVATLILGSVGRGYPSARKRKNSKCFSSCAECSPAKPWVAYPRVPERFREDVEKNLAHYPGMVAGRMGPFSTRQEALQALEDWWLKRLGVRP